MNLKKNLPQWLKDLVKRQIKNAKFKKFEQVAKHYATDDLVTYFKAAGFNKGDILFIHSSLRSLGYIEGGAKSVIEALKQVVGAEGTLVFPTFTMKLSMADTLSDSTLVFDPKTTLSTVGSITNAFLKMDGVYRSIHPTHSVAAWGKYAQFLTESHYQQETNFGPSTPFGKFLDLNGSIVGLGVNYAPITYYHVYEDYNIDKFPKVYVSEPLKAKVLITGNIVETMVWCHDIDFHKTRIEKDPEVESFIRNYLEMNGFSTSHKICDGKLWYIKAQDLIRELEVLYNQGKTIYHV